MPEATNSAVPRRTIACGSGRPAIDSRPASTRSLASGEIPGARVSFNVSTGCLAGLNVAALNVTGSLQAAATEGNTDIRTKLTNAINLSGLSCMIVLGGLAIRSPWVVGRQSESAGRIACPTSHGYPVLLETLGFLEKQLRKYQGTAFV